MKARKGRNWWVYVHHVIDVDLYYVGMTSNLTQRFLNNVYISTRLYKYLNLSVSLRKNRNIDTIILPVSDKEFALRLEDMLILKYRAIGKCINYRRGDIFNEETRRETDRIRQAERRKADPEHYRSISRNAYMRDPHKYVERSRVFRSTPEGKIYYRVANYNRRHKAIETPLEAKQKYLEWGYIPDYVKSDDLV